MKILNCNALIFDLDGTLYNKKNIAFYTMAIQWKNLHILNNANKIRKGLKGIDFENAESYYEKFYSSIAKETSRSVDFIEKWYQHSFYPGFVSILKKKYRAQKNLIEILKAMKGKLPLAVLSDYAFVGERLEALGISPDFFDITASSEDFGALKPSARSLEHIASEFGIPCGNVLVVGDRTDTDGKAAEMAGMMFYHINGTAGWNQFVKDIQDFLK